MLSLWRTTTSRAASRPKIVSGRGSLKKNMVTGTRMAATMEPRETMRVRATMTAQTQKTMSVSHGPGTG